MKRKNIVHIVTKKYMMQNKKRTFVTGLGILLMIVLMTCVFVGKETSIEYLKSVVAAKEGQWHMSIYDLKKEDEKLLENAEFIDEKAYAMHKGFLEFEQSANEMRPFLNIKGYQEKAFEWNNIVVSEGRMPEKDTELVLSVACLIEGSKVQLGDTITAQTFKRMLHNLGKGGDITFPNQKFRVLRNERVETPEQFPYFLPNEEFVEEKNYFGEEKTYTIVGFIETPNFENENSAAYTAFTVCSEEEVAQAGSTNVFLHFDTTKMKGNDTLDLKLELQDYVIEVNDMLLIFSANSDDITMNMLVNGMSTFFISLIMLSSVVLIYNVFELSFRERSKYLGMLSSVGATAKQKKSSIYYEAFTLMIIALPLGIGLGLVIVKLGVNAISKYLVNLISFNGNFEAQTVHLSVNIVNILFVILFSAVTVFISAYLPARKVSKIGAVESIRGNDSGKAKTYKMRKVGGFGVEGMLSMNFLTRQKRSKRSICRAIAVLLVIFLVTSFSGKMVNTVIDYSAHDSNYFVENDIKNMSILQCSSKNKELQRIEDDIEQAKKHNHEDMDLEKYLKAKEEERENLEDYLSDEEVALLLERIQNHPDVKRVEERYDYIGGFDVKDSFFSKEFHEADLTIKDAYMLTEQEREEWKEYEEYVFSQLVVLGDDTIAKIAKDCNMDLNVLMDSDNPGCIVVNEKILSTDANVYNDRCQGSRIFELENITDLQVGDNIPVRFYNKDGDEIDTNVPIAGIVKPDEIAKYVDVACRNGARTGGFFIASKNAAEHFAKVYGYDSIDAITEKSYYIDFQGEAASLIKDIEVLQENYTNIYYIPAGWSKIEMNMKQSISMMVRILLGCFVAMTSCICLMNLAASIGGKIALRKKDFAIMQSIGMERRQIQKMVVLETVGILVEGFIYGIVISGLMIMVVYKLLSGLVGSIPFTVPYVLFTCAFLFIIVAVLAIAIRCFQNQGAENILENIRNESV